MKTLYLIDGHAQFFRAYYAIRSRMTSPVTGEPTNMTYGFVGMLLKVLREYKPDYLAVVIDVSGDKETFRTEIYPDYKGHREEAPDDLGPQIDRCLQVLDLMGIPVMGQEGVEADDVIATLVKRLKKEEPELAIRIVSKDKDLTQLLNERIELFDVHTDTSVTAADIFKTEGVKPEHVLDILALMGDTSDNIPGVPGIGPKTAAKLILEYGSIDNLLANLDQLRGKQRKNLEASVEQLGISRQLVKLRDDLDVEFDLESARSDATQLPVEAMLAMFRELGFNRYQSDLKALAGIEAEEVSVQGVAGAGRGGRGEEEAGGGLFDALAEAAEQEQAQEAVTPTDAGTYYCIASVDELDKLIGRIKERGLFAVDTETDALSPMKANLCGIAIAVEAREGYYIPVRSPDCGGHLDEETVIERLRGVLEDERICKIGHNLKYDMLVLRRHGVMLSNGLQALTAQVEGVPLFDTMIASYVIDATRSSHRLDDLSLAKLHHTCIPIQEVIGRGRAMRRMDEVPLEVVTRYAGEDADVTLRLYEIFKPQVEAMGLWELFQQVEMPLVSVLAELEHNGIRVDRDELDRQRAKLKKRIDDLKESIAAALPHSETLGLKGGKGGEFNPDSPRQLAAALFNKPDDDPPGLGLKVIKRGKTGPSTDQEVLDKLAADPSVNSPLPELIIEYRQLTKLVNTYLTGLDEAINAETGRVHASFNQTVAETGRLSSSDPNLQNIPIRTEIGREIRRAFVAERGCVLITADYSQIELRLLAHLSGDPGLIEAFEQDMDIHTAVAAEVFGVDPAEVTASQRDSAKMVNFGIIYGITPYGLARRLGRGTSVETASRIISDYKRRFSRIDSFLQECIEHAKTHGYVETILKRRRSIPQVHSNKAQIRALGERMAINTVVQGSAADLIKVAMIDLYRQLPREFPEVKMLLQIHDELVFECPDGEAERALEFIVQQMEGAMALRVPLKAEAAYSANWIDAK